MLPDTVIIRYDSSHLVAIANEESAVILDGINYLRKDAFTHPVPDRKGGSRNATSHFAQYHPEALAHFGEGIDAESGFYLERSLVRRRIRDAREGLTEENSNVAFVNEQNLSDVDNWMAIIPQSMAMAATNQSLGQIDVYSITEEFSQQLARYRQARRQSR